MKKRKGILLLWEELSLAVLLILGSAAGWALLQALSQERSIEVKSDMEYLVQEELETLKSNHSCGTDLPLLDETVRRNGRDYTVALHEEEDVVEGVSMRKWTCRVSWKEAYYEASLLLAPDEAEEEGAPSV